MNTKLLLFIILGAANFFLGLSNAVQNKKGWCVLNAAVFGCCLYEVLERLV